MGKMITRYGVELVKESNKIYDVENVTSSYGAYTAFNAIFKMDKQAQEIVTLLVFNAKGGVLGAFEVNRGTLSSSIVGIGEIFKRILLLNGNSFIIAHNHPSGDMTPSAEDIRVTKRIAEGANLLGITFNDHLIIGDYYFSMREHGLF